MSADTSTTPAANAKRDALAKMMDELTEEQVKAVTEEIVMNNVATAEEVSEVLDTFKAAYPAAKNVGQYVLAFCLACADQGCSANTALVGKHDGVPYSALAGVIKEVCTVRQFCMYYSKLVWNVMIQRNRPPSNWAGRGYTREARFAAFDFFTGVSLAAPLKPKGGLVREPTDTEKLAHNANREIAIQMSRVRGLHTTNGMMALREQNQTAGQLPQLTM